jgi:hypothetical protein
MTSRFKLPLAGVLACLLAGCVQTDDTRSFYLHEDGKVDAVIFLDNVHSARAGPDGRKEEKEWLGKFKKGEIDEVKQLKESHAKTVVARLLREQAPFSAIVTAHFDSIHDLGHFLSGDKATRVGLEKSDKFRTLSVHIAPEHPRASPSPSGPSDEIRTVWRFVPVDGVVRSGKACVVAKDGGSCVIDFAELMKQDAAGGPIDFGVSWELR